MRRSENFEPADKILQFPVPRRPENVVDFPKTASASLSERIRGVAERVLIGLGLCERTVVRTSVRTFQPSDPHRRTSHGAA